MLQKNNTISAKQKIIVTGSSGMIGTRLCETFLEHGVDFVGVDYRPNKWNEAIDKYTIDIDLRNKKAVSRKMPEGDLIIHLAANARVHNLVENPDLAFENMQTVFNVLEHARKNSIKKIIFTSSREVYGNILRDEYTETSVTIDSCESPYTASKITGESLAQAYARCYGLEYIIFRLSNVYGRYDDSDRIIPLFLEQMQANEPIKIYGQDKVLDFTYIDDAVSGIVSGVEKFDAAKGHVCNLAYGQGTNLVDLARMMKAALGSQSTINIEPNRVGEVTHYVANVDKARRLLDFQPQHTIADGVAKTIAWYKANKDHVATPRVKRSESKIAAALGLRK